MPGRLIAVVIVAWSWAWGGGARAQEDGCEGGGGGDVIGAVCTRPSTQATNDATLNEDETHGRGHGAPSECSLVPIYVFDPAEPGADFTINISGRRQVLLEVRCNGLLAGFRWVDAADPTAAPAITAADLLPGVWISVQRQLPRPIPRIAPADLAPDGFAFVQMPTFFWVDQAQGQWAPVSGSASAGGITVSVQATPVRMVVSTGDGGEVVCEGAPPPYRHGAGSNPADFPGCAHTYRDSSAMADNGETYPVTLTVVWEASWSATTGEGGSLGTRETTSETRWLPVAEIQAVIVDSG